MCATRLDVVTLSGKGDDLRYMQSKVIPVSHALPRREFTIRVNEDAEAFGMQLLFYFFTFVQNHLLFLRPLVPENSDDGHLKIHRLKTKFERKERRFPSTEICE